MSTSIVNDQINDLISFAMNSKGEKSKRTMDAYSELLWTNLIKFGDTNINKIPICERVYFGYTKELINLFDIVTIDRQVIKYDYKRNMNKIVNKITADNEEFINQKTIELFELSNDKSIIKNLPLYLKFLAHAFGLTNMYGR